MNSFKMAGIALIVAGVLALVYGGFSYTKDGPLEFSVKDKEKVNIPVWAGVVAVVAGGGMLLAPRRS
jgi:hypothetical protein